MPLNVDKLDAGIINQGGSPVKPYKVYTALLTQSGTTAPVATVLENTIGNIVWSYSTPGSYLATLTGAFTNGKTFVSITGNAGGDGWVLFCDLSPLPNALYLAQYDSAGLNVDNCQCQIEIRVYN
jgi:hypothetical protein